MPDPITRLNAETLVPSSQKTVVGIVVAVVVVVVADVGLSLPIPSDALVAWTKWIGSVVGIVVSARVLWAGGQWIATK